LDGMKRYGMVWNGMGVYLSFGLVTSVIALKFA